MSKKKQNSLELCAETAPGLVREITDWILETSTKPQPALALGAALTLVAAVKGHRFQTETGLRTNLYCIGLAESGAGKEHPICACGDLLAAAGQENLLIGEPASDSGLFSSIVTNRGRALLLWDEVGHALKTMTGARCSPHETKIVKLMLQLFTKANSRIFGKQFSNFDGKFQRPDINQPHLCVWGATTLERFFEAITSDMAEDGFFPRWLLFAVSDSRKKRQSKKITDPPERLVKKIIELCNVPVNANPQGNMDDQLSIRPAVIPYGPGVKKLEDDYEDFFEAERARWEKRHSAFGAVWARASEHTAKIALTIADGDEIDIRSYSWAADLVLASLETGCSMFLNYVSDNEVERRVKKLYRVIETAGETGITRRLLTRKTQWAAYDRETLLNQLIESGQVTSKVDILNGRGRNPLVYFPTNSLSLDGIDGIS